MPLNLNDLMEKAKAKGINPSGKKPPSLPTIRPWQQESVLFVQPKEEVKTNRKQTDNKVETNRQQTDNKLTTKWKQEKTNRQQSGDTTDNTIDNKVTTNRQQSDNKPTTKMVFSSLVGLQRSIVLFIYNECKIARSKSTETLTLEYIGKTLNTSQNCVKTTIQRLERKGMIERIEYKNGRGGWSKYSIPDLLFQELLQHETGNKLETNWKQTGNKVVTQPTTQPTTSPASSSSIIYNNNIKTTTTNIDSGEYSAEQKKIILSGGWEEIDFECLERVGFTATHLAQIASQNILTPELVQNSIYAYSFDLDHNNKEKNIKGSALNYFIGILRKGQPYNYPSNFESPRERYMRLYAERANEVKQRQIAIEKDAFNLNFSEWFEKLPEEMLQELKLVPMGVKNNKHSKMVESMAKEYFSKEIWPSKKKEIEQGMI